MRNFPQVRAVTRQLRRVWRALPPFPLIPSPDRRREKASAPLSRISASAMLCRCRIGETSRKRGRAGVTTGTFRPCRCPHFKKAREWASHQRRQAAVHPSLVVDSTKDMLVAIRRKKKARRIAIAWAIVIVAGLGFLLCFGAGWLCASRDGRPAVPSPRRKLSWTMTIGREARNECARRSILLRPNPQPGDAVARLLSQSGDNSEALHWWRKFAEVQAFDHVR